MSRFNSVVKSLGALTILGLGAYAVNRKYGWVPNLESLPELMQEHPILTLGVVAAFYGGCVRDSLTAAIGVGVAIASPEADLYWGTPLESTHFLFRGSLAAIGGAVGYGLSHIVRSFPSAQPPAPPAPPAAGTP